MAAFYVRPRTSVANNGTLPADMRHAEAVKNAILRSNIVLGAAVSLPWHIYNRPSTRPMLQLFVMQFHLVSLNKEMPTGERWQVHKLNCRDIEKLVKRGDRVDIVSAESPEALIAAELANELSEAGWTAEDFRVMSCCKDAG